MTIETIFYLTLTLNLVTDLFFYISESYWEKNIFTKVIPGIRDHAPLDYDWTRELNYRKSNRRFGILSSVTGYVITLLVFRTGLFSWIMLFLKDHFPTPFRAGFIFAVITVLCLFLYRLPFSFYHTFILENRYGFNRKTIPLFVKDNLTSLALSLVLVPFITGTVNSLSGMAFGIPLIFIFMISFSLLFSFIFPILVMPLFYRISPLGEGSLQDKVNALIDRTKLTVKGVFTADQSRRSSHANAMVAGFGKSRRIILFDTLLEKMDEEEAVSVLAHEMGHWKEKHALILMAAGIMEQAILFTLLWLMWNSPLAYSIFGIWGMNLPRLVIILFILSSIMGLILSPLENLVSRKLEFRADRFAAVQTDPEHMRRALANLATGDLAWIPSSPLHSIWFSSHPSIPERILRIKDH